MIEQVMAQKNACLFATVPDLANFGDEGSNESSAEEGTHTSTDDSGGHTGELAT